MHLQGIANISRFLEGPLRWNDDVCDALRCYNYFVSELVNIYRNDRECWELIGECIDLRVSAYRVAWVLFFV